MRDIPLTGRLLLTPEPQPPYLWISAQIRRYFYVYPPSGPFTPGRWIQAQRSRDPDSPDPSDRCRTPTGPSSRPANYPGLGAPPSPNRTATQTLIAPTHPTTPARSRQPPKQPTVQSRAARLRLAWPSWPALRAYRLDRSMIEVLIRDVDLRLLIPPAAPLKHTVSQSSCGSEEPMPPKVPSGDKSWGSPSRFAGPMDRAGKPNPQETAGHPGAILVGLARS